MKKILASIFALMMVVATGIGLSACSYKKKPGTYVVDSVTAMGMTATQKSFSKYGDNRSEKDKKFNALYQPIAMIMNMEIKVNKDDTAVVTFKKFEDILGTDDRYETAISRTKSLKLLNKDGDLVVNAKVKVDESKEATYNIIPVVDGEETTWINIWGGSTPVSDSTIYCTIKDGQLAFNFKTAVYETPGNTSGVTLTTIVTVHMKKK